MNRIIIKIKLFFLVSILLFTSISISSALVYNKDMPDLNNLIFDEQYILFSPDLSTTTYLLNYNKEIIHTWESSYTPGHSVYLLENGNLLRPIFLGTHPIFLSGGMGGGVQIMDWNGTILWDFKYSSNLYLSHHDIEILPNGNILMIAWEVKSKDEAIAAGRDPDKVSIFGVWPDHIIEVKPTGLNSGEIIWEWHVWDHLIQDFDSTMENYGVVEDHPELIDINFGAVGSDWLHTNSIDYNVELNQILLSIHNFNEIWVIDHSTSTEAAAGHTGGDSGKGGDLLYRWGNPKTYRAGTTYDQKLFGQHDARWIESGFPGEGNILVFNNGLGRPGTKYSSIDEITPPIDNFGEYIYTPGLKYGPQDPVWIYTAEKPTDFYSYMISGAKRIANGNTVICDGKKGHFFEVTYNKEIVWEYINPFPNLNLNDVFKIEIYPSDYPGLPDFSQKPTNPEKPKGEIKIEVDKEYYYTSCSSDPQEDKIFYFFDWGDGTTSGWLGPYNSGTEVTSSNIWRVQGIYDIKVKAMDINNHESGWSEPLKITISRTRTSHWMQLLDLFPVLQRILYLLH